MEGSCGRGQRGGNAPMLPLPACGLFSPPLSLASSLRRSRRPPRASRVRSWRSWQAGEQHRAVLPSSGLHQGRSAEPCRGARIARQSRLPDPGRFCERGGQQRRAPSGSDACFVDAGPAERSGLSHLLGRGGPRWPPSALVSCSPWRCFCACRCRQAPWRTQRRRRGYGQRARDAREAEFAAARGAHHGVGQVRGDAHAGVR